MKYRRTYARCSCIQRVELGRRIDKPLYSTAGDDTNSAVDQNRRGRSEEIDLQAIGTGPLATHSDVDNGVLAFLPAGHELDSDRGPALLSGTTIMLLLCTRAHLHPHIDDDPDDGSPQAPPQLAATTRGRF